MSASQAPLETAPGPVRRLQAPTPRAALALGLAAGLLLVADLVRPALTPFILGLLLAYLLAPAVDRITRVAIGSRHMPRWLAILVIYLVIAVTVAAAARVLVLQVQTFIDELPRLLAAAESWFAGLDLPDWLRALIDRAVASAGAAGAEGRLDPSSLLPVARTLAGTIASLFGYLIVPIWVFYLVKDLDRLMARARSAIPQAWRRDTLAILHIVDHTFGRWIRGQLVLGLVVGIATFAGLLLLGQLVDPVFLEFSYLLAVVAGLLELVPVIGPILSMLPTLLVAVTAGDPVRAVVAVILLYLVVQQVENNVLVPKIQGDAVELHPAIVLVALLVGGALLGLLGAILALPVTAAARDIYRYLFRRLSEDDPTAAHPDAPDLARKTGHAPVVRGTRAEAQVIPTPRADGPIGGEGDTTSPG